METIARRLWWKMRNPDSTFSIVPLACLVAALSYLVPRLEGALISDPQTIWPLWPVCALLVPVLLLVPRRIWTILIPVAFVAFVLYDLQAGVPIRSIAWFIPADTVEVLIAAFSLSHFFGGVPRLNSLKALAKYSFFAVFLAPLAGAFLAAPGIRSDYWNGWRICFFSEMLAFLTLTPALLSWVSEGPAWMQKPRAYHLEAAGHWQRETSSAFRSGSGTIIMTMLPGQMCRLNFPCKTCLRARRGFPGNIIGSMLPVATRIRCGKIWDHYRR
jgi:hypothetical protein